MNWSKAELHGKDFAWYQTVMMYLLFGGLNKAGVLIYLILCPQLYMYIHIYIYGYRIQLRFDFIQSKRLSTKFNPTNLSIFYYAGNFKPARSDKTF